MPIALKVLHSVDLAFNAISGNGVLQTNSVESVDTLSI